jgi:hypothetical protein
MSLAAKLKYYKPLFLFRASTKYLVPWNPILQALTLRYLRIYELIMKFPIFLHPFIDIGILLKSI